MKPRAKRVAIYDFDSTIFRSPDREQGSTAYFEHYGELWPYPGWWGRLETLLPPIIPDPIPAEYWIESTVAAFRKDRECPETNVYLMTGRPAKMRHRVKEILDSNNMVFDDYFFRGMKGHPQHGDTLEIKLGIIENHLVHPALEILEVWEDRPEYTSRFCQMAKRWKGVYKTHLRKVIVHDVLTEQHNEF